MSQSHHGCQGYQFCHQTRVTVVMTGDDTDCVFCEECAEAEETAKHQTYETTWHNQMATF